MFFLYQDMLSDFIFNCHGTFFIRFTQVFMKIKNKIVEIKNKMLLYY